MDRRKFLTVIAAGSLYTLSSAKAFAAKIEKFVLSNKEWRMKLSDKQYEVLRDEGTEASWSSALNNEKRKGIYVCAGCDLPLFTSEMKYDSGSGWPSFTKTIEGAIKTKLDFKILYPRTEYHCSRCGGHQGHVFNDGPEPTGKRWCNNGLALKFNPSHKDKS